MLNDPPARDEIEVSIFGPGKGESVVVHLGDGDWIVVDSCVDQGTKTNPALNYLTSVGADLAHKVHLVVATHAHDDHFKGISDIYEACESAYLVCSEACTSEELFALVAIDDKNRSILRKSALEEYRKLNDLVDSRGFTRGVAQLRYGSERKPLLELHSRTVPPAVVTALSPSSQATTRARRMFVQELQRIRRVRRSPFVDPNELAVALWIEVGSKTVLLGADLLNGPAGCGWGAVLATFEPQLMASLFKVPHHGSENADHPGVWAKLLQESPVALLAPYRAGPKPLPSRSDRVRICARTMLAHITANPELPAPSKDVRREIAGLGPLAMNAREPWGVSGHVRARSRFGDDGWSVQHSWPARRLCEGR